MLRKLFIALAVLLLLVVVAGEAWAERRVALVIGNGAYRHATTLANPPNDAADVAQALSRLGFETITVVDGDRGAMLDALSRFGRAINGADTALFFYAGHGLQVAGRNYLVPVSAKVEQATDLTAEALRVDDVIEVMEAAEARVKLVFLDACRDNPLVRPLSRSGAGRGLARLNTSTAGTFIAFATAPGDVASDGTGRNSPFTQGLLAHMATPGVEIRQMIGKVRGDVYEATGKKQLPWVNESLLGEFYLAGSAQAAAPAAASALPSKPDPDIAGLQQQIDQLRRELVQRKQPPVAPPAPQADEAEGLRKQVEALKSQLAALPPAPPPTPPKAQPATLPPPASSEPLAAQRGYAPDFIFPDSDRRYLVRRDLLGLSKEQLRIARNEIYARRGRYFQNSELATYFSRHAWYRPHTWNPPLNLYEKANIDLLKRAEDGR